MHSHGPGGGLPPPPTRPTATHRHIINPAIGCHYFPPGPQLPSQPSDITALRPVPSYTAWWQRHIGVRNLPRWLVKWRKRTKMKLVRTMHTAQDLKSTTLDANNLSRTKQNNVSLDEQRARQVDYTRVTYCPLQGDTLWEWTVEVNVTGRRPLTGLDAPFNDTSQTHWRAVAVVTLKTFDNSQRPHVGPGHPSSPLSIYFLIFSPFYFFLSFLGFTYFLLLSIPSLSTRIVPLRFQAGGRRRRPNLGLVFLCNLCYLYSLVKMDCGVLFYLVNFVCSFSALTLLVGSFDP